MMPLESPAPLPAPLEIHWSGMTHVGRVRPNNEDSFLALTFDGHEVRYLGKLGQATLRGGDFVFAVSDGMGGAKSGEFASKIAVDRITRLFPRVFRLAAAGMSAGFDDLLGELMIAIHNDLLKLGYSYEECAGMGATLSLGWFTPEWMYFAHIGDSRIYYLPQEGGITQLTHDHTHVGWLRRQGKINEREARTHPRRNALQQVLGAGHQFADPHIGAVRHRPGDRFLLCSDGLIDGLWDRQLEEFIRTPPAGRDGQTPAQCLVEEALDRSGRDNTTAVVVELRAATPRTPIFVYGTLKRGGTNHHLLARQNFVGPARTAPGFRLYELDGYPGMIPESADQEGVVGELWEVDAPSLAALDELEGLSEGLYRRGPIALLPPYADRPTLTYFYARPVEGRPPVGPVWPA